MILKIALALLTIDWGWAEPILFRASGATELEYRARLRADEKFRTPTEAYLEQHPGSAARDLLLTRFARAQTAFLKNSAGDARRHFLEVVALLPTDDWQAPDREILLHAYLRLAQLENGAADRAHWLEQARFLGSGLHVSEELFPPPLLAQFRALERNGPRLIPDLRAVGWPSALVNGVPCRPGSCPSFPAAEGSVRVTLLSDQWQPQTLHVDLATLGRQRPPRIEWIRGECAHHALGPAARELGSGRAFFSIACEAPAPDPLAAPVRDVALPIASASPATLDYAVTAPPPPAPTGRAFYRSPWFWSGVGAVALGVAAVVWSSSNHRASTPAPPRGPEPEPGPPVVFGFR